jgi:hypothetical protein
MTSDRRNLREQFTQQPVLQSVIYLLSSTANTR